MQQQCLLSRFPCEYSRRVLRAGQKYVCIIGIDLKDQDSKKIELYSYVAQCNIITVIMYLITLL